MYLGVIERVFLSIEHTQIQLETVMKYISKVCTLTTLVLVLASYGFSSSTTHSMSAKTGLSEILTLATIAVNFKDTEQFANSADVAKRSNSKKLRIAKT